MRAYHVFAPSRFLCFYVSSLLYGITSQGFTSDYTISTSEPC
jgi:hypothetical protein